MGQYIFKLLNSFSDMKAKILMLGLDGAGKTTVLYQMKLHESTTTVPTIGFNVEEIDYKGLKFTVWDIGGQSKLRDLWHHYYQNSNAIIYVLDTADKERFETARDTLQTVMGSDDLKDCPVLVLANKVDISGIQPVRVVEALGLHQTRREWHVQPTCALTGDGIV